MIKMILSLSLYNAVIWAGATALLANTDWPSVAFIEPGWVPWVFIGVLILTLGVLYFITSAWKGEVDG